MERRATNVGGRDDDVMPGFNTPQPLASSLAPSHHAMAPGRLRSPHTTELSVSRDSLQYDRLPTVTSQTFDNTLCPSVQLYNPPDRPVTADTVHLPRKRRHFMGRVRRQTQGATPPSYVCPVIGITIGLVFFLVGLSITVIGFTSDQLQTHILNFMKAAGPTFMIMGAVSLILSYLYFCLVIGRHIGKHNKKDAAVPPPDPDRDAAGGWGEKQRSPEQRIQTYNLFRADCAVTQLKPAQQQGPAKAMPQIVTPRDEDIDTNPIRRPLQHDTDTHQLDVLARLPTGSGRGSRLPPLNPTLPDSARNSIRNSGRKKGPKDDYVWREEDFPPMRSVPSDSSMFVVGDLNTNPLNSAHG